MKVLKFKLFLIVFTLTGEVLKNVRADDKPNYKFIVDSLEKVEELEGTIEVHLTFDEYEHGVKISGEVKQFVDLNNEWKVNIEIFQADHAEDEGKILMALPEMGVCDLIKSYYKIYFYQSLKNYANAPGPDKCPVTKETYVVKDYPFEVYKLKRFIKPGYYVIKTTLLNKGMEVAKYVMKGHTEED